MRIPHSIRNRGLTRSALSIIAGLLIPALATPASAKVRPPAKKDKEACALDYAKGKERADAASLREAKELFSRCAKASCGGFLQQECGHLYTQLDSDIPSVVPFVTDESGMPRALVEVKMDGVLLTSRLDGHALQVDPGKREFSFETDDGVFATRKIMILQGQHNIPVKALLPSGRRRASATALATGDSSMRQAAFEVPTGKSRSPESSDTHPSSTAMTPEAAAPQIAENDAEAEVPATTAHTRATPSRGIPALSYVFGGVGLVGVAGYFLLNTWGRKDNDALGSCASAGQLCQPSDVDHIRKLYLAANISGGIGLAALATSAWLYVRSSSSSSEETAPTRSASLRGGQRISLRTVDVQSSSTGALATIGGAF